MFSHLLFSKRTALTSGDIRRQFFYHPLFLKTAILASGDIGILLSHPPKDSGIYSGRRREREFTIFSFLKTEVSVSGGIRRFLKNDGDCFAAILVYKGENDSDSHHFADDNVFLYLQRVFVKVLSLNEGVDKNARKGWFFQN